jgi:hypothetical protein
MRRSILTSGLIILLVFVLGGIASAQDFLLRESDPAVVALSRDTDDVVNVFRDSDNDGVYDTVTINGVTITGQMRTSEAEGFRYQDGRCIVLYPATFSGLPDPGTSAILGFIHYFDDQNISTYLAIVAEQATGDDTTNGLAVFFYDSAGLRVGAPSSMFVEKARLRSLPIYQEWVQTNKDFGIGSNPLNSQYFAYAKDLGLTDHILVVLFQLYQ